MIKEEGRGRRKGGRGESEDYWKMRRGKRKRGKKDEPFEKRNEDR